MGVGITLIHHNDYLVVRNPHPIKSFKAIWGVPQPTTLLRGLTITIVMNHLLTWIILQVPACHEQQNPPANCQRNVQPDKNLKGSGDALQRGSWNQTGAPTRRCQGDDIQDYRLTYIYSIYTGPILIFHQPRFPEIRGFPFLWYLLRSCKVAIIWPILIHKPDLHLQVISRWWLIFQIIFV